MTDRIMAAAEALAALRLRQGASPPIDDLPEPIRPRSIEEAYHVQAALRPLLSAALGPVAGWKIGCTSTVMQTYLGVDHPCMGTLFAGQIYEGAARVEKRDPFTPTRQVAVLGPHACFGEMAILDDSPRSASVTATEDTTAFRFPAAMFQMLLEEHSVAAYKLVHAMAKTLCVRQRRMNQQLSDLADEQGLGITSLTSRRSDARAEALSSE